MAEARPFEHHAGPAEEPLAHPSMQPFSGGPESDDLTATEAFIRRIHLYGIAQNRHEDDRWMAALAASSLSGPALAWFCEQPEEVQTSWRNMRRYMLAKFGQMPVPVPVPAAFIPDAPAAGPPPARAPVPVIHRPSSRSSQAYNDATAQPGSNQPQGTFVPKDWLDEFFAWFTIGKRIWLIPVAGGVILVTVITGVAVATN